MLGHSKGIFLWMPSPHLNLLGHVYLGGFLLAGTILLILGDDFLALVGFVSAYVFASLVHELDVDLAVRLVFGVDHVDISVVASCDDHTAVWRNLQIEFVEDVL